jgi:protein-disulfide isomerase
VGVDVAKWETCFDTRKYQQRINANLADGLRRGVGSTPSFIIGNKLYRGMTGYDELRKIVDSLVKAGPAPTATTPAPATTKKK